MQVHDVEAVEPAQAREVVAHDLREVALIVERLEVVAAWTCVHRYPRLPVREVDRSPVLVMRINLEARPAASPVVGCTRGV